MKIISEIPESRVKHEKRIRILSTAYEAFVASGIENISMQDIAERSGMQRRNLYNYYEDKEQIAVALMNCWYREMDRFNNPGNSDWPALELIRERLWQFYEFAVEDPKALIYSVHFDHYFRNHVDSTRYQEYKSLAVPIFIHQNLLVRGIEDGSIHPKFRENASTLNSVLQSAVLAYTQKTLFYAQTSAREDSRNNQKVKVFIEFLVQALASGE